MLTVSRESDEGMTPLNAVAQSSSRLLVEQERFELSILALSAPCTRPAVLLLVINRCPELRWYAPPAAQLHFYQLNLRNV